jgi:hypothetical protein
MKEMFRGASKFNQDISPWNMSGVLDMSCMFYSASSFNQSLYVGRSGGSCSEFGTRYVWVQWMPSHKRSIKPIPTAGVNLVMLQALLLIHPHPII